MHQTVEKYKKIDEQWAESSYLPNDILTYLWPLQWRVNKWQDTELVH